MPWNDSRGWASQAIHGMMLFQMLRRDMNGVSLLTCGVRVYSDNISVPSLGGVLVSASIASHIGTIHFNPLPIIITVHVIIQM